MHSNVAEGQTCPRCGSPLSAGVTGGLCPFCVGRISVLGSVPGRHAGDVPPPPPTFGDYELLAEAGRGAMGVVYRARQIPLNRIVALKMILSGPFAGDAERQRFQAEAEAVARLDHPNIVPIHEFGERDGRQFYAMRWLEGGPLSIGVGLPQATRLMATVSRAVHHAHQRGVLHRDLKPGNILLDEQGEPSVADFGLSRRMDAEASLTASGSPLGTPAFMSPEQAAGDKSLTTAADVWGLGAVLYYLITGRAPFQGKDVFEVVSQVREGFVAPPHRWNPAIDRDLEIICLKCLRKEPSARYESAAAVADDLERWARREPIHARPLSALDHARLFALRRPAVTALSLLAALLFLSGLAGVGHQWQRAERERDRAQHRLLQLHAEKAQRAVEAGDPMATLPWMASALAAERPASAHAQSYRYFLANTLRECLLPQEIWWFDSAVKEIAFSPDGHHLAASAGEADLLLADLDAVGRVVTTHRLRGGGKQVAFSPDGTRLFNAQDEHIINGVLNDGFVKVFALPALTALPDLPVQPGMAAMCLSHDGHWLATATANGTAEIHDTATRNLVCPPLRCAGPLGHMQFNPAGTRLVTVSGNTTVQLWEMPTGRELKNISGETFWRARFSPDGTRLLVVSRREGKAQVYDDETLAPIGPPLKHEARVHDAIFSPDGSRIATASDDHTARLWNAQTGEPSAPPLPHANEVHCLAFSPDGTMLATGGSEPAARVWEVATGKPLTPWLRHGGEIFDAKFSPSGRQLLTCSRDGTVRLWPMPVAKPESQPLAGQPLPIWRTRFSDDGKLAFCVSENRGRAWRTDTWQPLTPELHADGPMDFVQFSPDGQRLLVGSRDHRVRVWKFNLAQPIASFLHSNEVEGACWLPDSRRIFSASEAGDFVLWEADTGRVLKTFSTDTGLLGTFAAAVSPDGCWLAGSSRNQLALWNAATGSRLWLTNLPGAVIRELRFSPDSSLLVSGDEAGEVRVLRTSTGELAVPAIHHTALIGKIRFSPDGQRLATASDDLTARIWNPLTGQPLTPPLKLSRGVADVQFSPGGRWLTIANETSFQAWDAVSGDPVSLIQNSPEPLSGGTFLDDQRSVTVSISGVVREYCLEVLDWPVEQLIPAMELLAGMKLDAHGDLSPLPPAGTEGSAARRQEAEATWAWLRERLKTGSPSSR